MSRSSCSVPLQKRLRISRFCALFSTGSPACLVSKQAYLACSVFGRHFKVKPAIVLNISTGTKPQRAQERHAGKSRENLISCLLSLAVH